MHIPTVDVHSLKAWLDTDQVVLIDVREQEEYDSEHIQPAHLMPLSTFDASKVDCPVEKKLVLHCRSGMRSHKACELIKGVHAEQYSVYNLDGGILAWIQAGYPVE